MNRSPFYILALGGILTATAVSNATALPLQLQDRQVGELITWSIHDRRTKHSHNRSKPRDLPQEHIDWCLRQNMGYRVFDNTIAVDRYTRRQCSSPYYQAS